MLLLILRRLSSNYPNSSLSRIRVCVFTAVIQKANTGFGRTHCEAPWRVFPREARQRALHLQSSDQKRASGRSGGVLRYKRVLEKQGAPEYGDS